jgi:hypothetical protein
MRHPVSHLVAQTDLELCADGAAHLAVAKGLLAGDHAADNADASGALDAALEDFQEIQNRNAEDWHRGPAVDVEAVADGLAETFYLKGRVAETAANVNASRSDLGWAGDFYARAAEQLTPKQSYYQQAFLAFRLRTPQ